MSFHKACHCHRGQLYMLLHYASPFSFFFLLFLFYFIQLEVREERHPPSACPLTKWPLRVSQNDGRRFFWVFQVDAGAQALGSSALPGAFKGGDQSLGQQDQSRNPCGMDAWGQSWCLSPPHHNPALQLNFKERTVLIYTSTVFISYVMDLCWCNCLILDEIVDALFYYSICISFS